MGIKKSTIRFYASANAVINQYLFLPGNDRVKNIVDRVTAFSETEVVNCLSTVMHDFGKRHRDIESFFLQNFDKVSLQFQGDLSEFSTSRKKLLGAYFTKEYSIMAAALFNPSIVPHPNQQNLNAGQQRFVMSLRATGEGHISSIVFKTGTVDDSMNITLDADPAYFTSLKKNTTASYSKEFILKRAAHFPDFKKYMLDCLPDDFNAEEAFSILNNLYASNDDATISLKHLVEIIDTNYELQSSATLPLNEKVIFPNAKAECMGMEDVRFVKFTDGDKTCYYGSYTAYDGKQIRTQMIETIDFDVFKIRTLYGAAIADKGMALFPEKINEKYVMISRQGGEKMSIMYSTDLFYWEKYKTLMEPKYAWDLVQLGNCGSPIKTEKGWLLLTHAVGTMRTYTISAVLLDLADPSKIIGRMETPLIAADETEREGYVPNVVYTCGLLQHGDQLLIPYAVSDSATGFATIAINELLNQMKM